jgi:hypothetical protein
MVENFEFKFDNKGMLQNTDMPHINTLDFIVLLKNMVLSTITVHQHCISKEVDIPHDKKLEAINTNYRMVIDLLQDVEIKESDYKICVDKCRSEEIMEHLAHFFDEKIEKERRKNELWLEYMAKEREIDAEYDEEEVD